MVCVCVCACAAVGGDAVDCNDDAIGVAAVAAVATTDGVGLVVIAAYGEVIFEVADALGIAGVVAVITDVASINMRMVMRASIHMCPGTSASVNTARITNTSTPRAS